MTHHTTTYNNSSYSFLHLWKIRMTCLFLIMTVMGVESAWAQTVSKWDGANPATTWNAANRTAAGITGAGTEADPYVIHDAKGFVYFWWGANNGKIGSSTEYWKLDADIDLDNKTWSYVDKNGTFKGKFDGQNHTISNMSLVPPTANLNYGLFCVIQGANATNHAEVKNLTISNSTIAPSADFTKTTSIGILAGKADGNVDISNITISGTNSITYSKKINDENYIGGLLGQITGANTSVTNCHVSSLTMTAKSTTTNAYFAGLIGRINVQGTVTNCSTTDVTINYELIANASRLAGLVGNSKGTNTGTPTVINGCTATRTKIKLPKGINNVCYIGALIGQINNQQQVLTNNTVDSPEIAIGTDIKAASYIGGAIGDFSGNSADYMGSLTGLTVTSPSVTVDKVSIKDNYIGAVFGRINTYSTISNVAVSTKTGAATLTYKNTGAPNFALNLGSFAGGIFGNAAQETAVTNIDVTGDATVTIGSNNNVQNIKAGLIGQSTTNVRFEDWTIVNTNVDVKGSLINNASQLGGFAGYLASGNGAPLNMTNVKITGNSTVSVSGNISVVSQIAGFAGQIANANNADAKVNIDDAGITGTSTISVGGNVASGSHFGGFTGNLLGRAQLNALVDVKNISLGTSNITITGQVTTGSYYGGLVGLVSQGCKLTNWEITTASNLTFNNNINAASYIGGAFGNFTGAAGYPSFATGISVTGLDISLNTNFTTALYVGGIAGQLVAIDGTPNKIEKCFASGKIHSVDSHTFKQGNITYAFGGIVGYTGQGLSAMSEIKKCVSEVDIDLSSMKPETSSGDKYNLYQNGFVVGGAVGRINTPSRMPENMYYSGKIYAPFAAVGPIVGVFLTSMGAASYVYDDYSANSYAVEWDKTKAWYYTNYKIGLSDAVLTQTERTRNYTVSPVDIDGIKYLEANETNLIELNTIGANTKFSRTVLPYINSGGNITNDKYIFPAWNTNSATYSAYYMYYMQGINAGYYRIPEASELVKALVLDGKSFNPEMISSGNSTSGHVFTVDLGDISIGKDIDLAYQWYQSDKTTPFDGETTQSLTLNSSELEEAGHIVYCKITVTIDEGEPFSFMLSGWAGGDVVYVDAKNGIDNASGSKERGWSPATAVKTLDHANCLLKTPAEGGTWDNNIIVIIGELSKGSAEGNCFKSRGTNPATITGKYNEKDYGGIINLVKGLEAGANPGDGLSKNGFHNYVSADTKFENLVLRAAHDVDNMFLELHGHDVWLGKGLRMQGFRDLSAGHGNLDEDKQTTPEFSIILTSTNPAHPDEAYWTRTKPQVLTIESGHYGRILGGRYVSGFFTNGGNTSHSILATAKHPAWAVINIDIDPGNDMKSADGKKTYTCDVNCIVAGLTDGSIYGDYQINIHGGNVRYAVGANQGNSVVSGDKTYTPIGGTSGKWGQWPNASFFGRTIINVEQKDGLKPITLNNLYAGGLGRNADANSSANTVVDMYVYGHTEINMKSGNVSKNVYGGGAGGVIGINPWDAHIPYATNDADNASSAIFNGVQYGDNRVTGAWSTKNVSDPLVNVVLHKIDEDGNFTSETEMLNLANSSTTLNITGGNIGGNVFGGGNGYVSNMPILGTMQGVGSVFGTSNVNISGGTISGSVYGGSEGNSGYYGKVNKHGQKITHIAEMNGTVNINITGASTHIGGNIYGAGQGIASTSTQEYTDIATAGNAELGEEYKTNINVLIDLPDSNPFTGNIYGGGQMGAVDGKTHVTIKGGVFEKDIFGAGKGEDGHINKAKVTGTSGVTIDGGEVNATIYGGGALAIVDGNTDVNLNAGIVSQDVFGGGMGELNNDHTVKTSADVTGTANVTANGTTFKFPESGIDEKVNHNIYGGGNLASIVGATNVTINKGLLPAGFLDGDAASRWGKWITAVNAQTDNVVQGSVFGGGYGVNTRVTNTAAVHVNVTDNDATNKAMIDVIGGGYNGCVLSNTDVTVAGVAEVYKVYGGGLGSYEGYTNAPTEKRSHANLATYTKQQTIGSVGEGKENDGTSVTIHGGKIYDNIFGGGAGLKYDAHGVSYLRVAEVFGKSNVIVDAIDNWVDDANSFSNKIYGGGALGLVNNEILVDIKSGTFQGAELFAGSLGEKGHLDKAQVTASATIRTSANDSKPAGALQGYFNIYGGCDMAQMVGDTHVELHHGTFSGSIFGAGKGLASEETSPGVWDEHLDYGKVTGNTLIVIDEPSLVLGKADGLNTDGLIKDIKKAIKIYGGGALGLVDGTINPVALKSGTLYGEVFGGSLGEMDHPNKAKVTMPKGKMLGVKSEASMINKDSEGKPAALNGKITIYGGCDMALVDGNTNVEIGHGAFIGNVFGGGKGISGSEVYGKVDGDASVLIKGGDTRSDVYGGGALGNVTGKTTVDLAGGAVNDVYGGGLGDANTAAIVFGDALVTLNGSTVDGVTNDCKVYGSIFGCNNVNGTPKGHVKVHVLKTITRAGQSTPRNQKEEKTNSYDVFAVYGGGNHAAYQPENKDEYAEVLIENCDNSIDYVYGGGNAAPVPATSVTIYGADAINNAFAGGNGAGADNPGADVGYKGHYSKGSREEYGSGEAHINIYGGTINNVYGGSNTLGYIRTHAYVEVLNVPDGDTEHNCDLRLGEVHAGGNEAEMYCGGSVTLACSEGAEVIYAGSSEADIHGDIDLVITSGTYGKVFGGNNHSGNVYGGITINIDETGCWPIMIGELYACGNEAAYSVYGYTNEGPRTKEQFDAMTAEQKIAAGLKDKDNNPTQYADPEINLISFSRIGKVFGGGYAAAVYGSPTINVEPIPGIYATGESKPNYMLNGSDERIENKGNSSVAVALGADKIGSIGTIYGGGNKGAVYGNTNVLIGTKTTNKHVSGTDKTTEHDDGVTITGNIFGGGNEAIVSGDTNVTIGENN